jgi:hypothetical protein
MNNLSKTLSAALLLAPLAMGVYAAEEQSKAQEHAMPGMGMQHGQGGMQGMGMQHGQGGMQGMGGMGMMGGMSEEQMDQHMRMMQEHMLQMHDLSDKILAATDPAEKEKLKKQQLDLMKAHKKQMMHGGMGAMGQKKEPPAQQDIQHQKH